MLNFFAIVLIIFIGIFLLVLKKRSFRKLINKGKLHSVKLKKNKKNNNKFLSDKKSFLYLIGTTLEYSGGLNGKGFIFKNPNASRTCGCGESFSL